MPAILRVVNMTNRIISSIESIGRRLANRRRVRCARHCWACWALLWCVGLICCMDFCGHTASQNLENVVKCTADIAGMPTCTRHDVSVNESQSGSTRALPPR